MKLPVTVEYLSKALIDGYQGSEFKLNHRHVGELVLETGHLVACDPLVISDAQPFTLRLPTGSFPVLLSIAQAANDQRVAFSSIRFSEKTPIEWSLLTNANQDLSKLREDEYFGYSVDAGTGCFMDLSVSQALVKKLEKQPNFYETIIAGLEKNDVPTWSWLDMALGPGNLIAFSSGYGDGLYATYGGFDSQQKIAAVVTDFAVSQFE